MDVSDETLSKASLRNSGFKSYKSPSILSNRFISEYEDTIDTVEENKSVCTIKKIYSIDRIAYNGSLSKIEAQNKSNEKINRSSKLFRTSSTTLEWDHTHNEFNLSKITSGTHHRNQISGNDLFLMDVLDMKKYALSNYIQENSKAADIKWSLFCAACHSYRFDSVLRPFPPMFLEGDIKNIDKLRDVTESCPSISVLYEQLQERNSKIVSPDLVNLLYWVLIHIRDPQLKFIPQDMHKTVLSQVMSTSASATPKYIFQALYNKESNVEMFNNLAKKYKVIHAFHGSRLDNFYSILNFGLRVSFNKATAYGPGVYLSSEMNVSLPYSRAGFSWGGSYFGSQISIVALCEVVDHPDVKYMDESNRKTGSFWGNMRSMPDKYFIVQNSELVRVKYILIYPERASPSNRNQLSTVVGWLQRNKVVAVVMAYVILLLAIATSSNSTVYKYYKRFMRKILT